MDRCLSAQVPDSVDAARASRAAQNERQKGSQVKQAEVTLSANTSANREIRRLFIAAFARKFVLISPILSGVALSQIALGFLAGAVERWSLSDSMYFTCITALTIGYGDLVPKLFVSRCAAVGIGLMGVVVMALIAAIAVRALEETAIAVSSRRRLP